MFSLLIPFYYKCYGQSLATLQPKMRGHNKTMFMPCWTKSWIHEGHLQDCMRRVKCEGFYVIYTPVNPHPWHIYRRFLALAKSLAHGHVWTVLLSFLSTHTRRLLGAWWLFIIHKYHTWYTPASLTIKTWNILIREFSY